MQHDAGTFLIVDDDPVIREMCRTYLEDKGHLVFEAEDGERAIPLALAHRIDLIILDILMPEKDGLEVLLELKRSQPSSRIYAMSGGGTRGNYSYLEIAKRFGADGVIKKPFSPNILVELLRSPRIVGGSLGESA